MHELDEEDLGIKVVSPIEAVWTRLKERLLKDVENAHNEIMVNSAIIELCDIKINEEQEKAQSS